MSNLPTAAVDEPLYGATPVQAVRRFFRRYVVFTGRASRSEFWWTYLFVVVVVLVLGLLGTLLGALTSTAADAAEGQTGAGVVFAPITIALFLLAIVVPGIALVVRRIHDANLSGLLALLWLIPYLGGLVILILCILPSQPTGRRFDRASAGWGPGGPQAYGAFGASPYGQPPSPYGQPAPYGQYGQPPVAATGGPGYTTRPVPIDPASAPADEVARAVQGLTGPDRTAVAALADRMRATLARTEGEDLLIVTDGRVVVRYGADGRVVGVTTER